MVDAKINLLKNRRSISEADYQKEQKILKYSTYAFLITILVLLSVSIYNFALSRQVSNTLKSTSELLKKEQGLLAASSSQIYLKTRLGLVTEFMKNRTIIRETLQKIFSTTIEGASITSVSFDDPKVLGIIYTSKDVNTLNKLTDYYKTDTGYFTQIVNTGITREASGKYQIGMKLTLPNGDK